MGIPVVVSTNGYGLPVKAVSSNAPVLTVTDNGYGTPIVLSDLGVPFVVEIGGANLFYEFTFNGEPYTFGGSALTYGAP